MSLVIKNYFKNYSEKELQGLSVDDVYKIHHKAWMKDALECMKRNKYIKIFDENRCPDGILVSTIIESYGNQYHEIAKSAAEKIYSERYSKDFVEELCEYNEFSQLCSFAEDTKDGAALDRCFKLIKEDYLKEHLLS